MIMRLRRLAAAIVGSVVLFGVLLAAEPSGGGAAVVVEWDPSTTPGVAYRLHWGPTANGPYPNTVDATNTTAAMRLEVGTWYAVVTAHRDGLESGPSNEIAVTITPAPAGRLRVVSITVTTTTTLAPAP